MPKINFYIDIPVGTKPTDDLTAMTRPYQKYPGMKRFKVIIDLPSSAFEGEIDGIIEVDEVECDPDDNLIL